MPKDEFEDGVLEAVVESLYETIDDTTYTQRASLDAWMYVEGVCRERIGTIRSEMTSGG